MAKSNSFNKREVEKSKQQKRKLKQQRREERKKKEADSFEDMIAYVDENGMITSTPPDPSEIEVVDVDEIDISIPKKEEVDRGEDLVGHVEFFDENKGFGFIKDAFSVNTYFFHKSNVDFADIKENNKVTFKLEKGPKGMNAIEVKLAND